MLKGSDGQRELSHRVQVVRAAVDELGDEAGEVAASGPLGGQVADLLLRRDLASEEKPEETLWERLLATGSLWKKLLAFWDGLAAETNTLLGVEDGTLPDQRLDATSTAVDLVQGHLAHLGVAMLFAELLDLLNLLRQAGGECLLQGLQ